MRTSLTELRQAALFLQDKLPPEDALVYQSRLLTDLGLRRNMQLLQKTFGLLKIYHRRQLKREAESTLQNLLNDPDKTTFRSQVNNLFNP